MFQDAEVAHLFFAVSTALIMSAFSVPGSFTYSSLGGGVVCGWLNPVVEGPDSPSSEDTPLRVVPFEAFRSLSLSRSRKALSRSAFADLRAPNSLGRNRRGSDREFTDSGCADEGVLERGVATSTLETLRVRGLIGGVLD